MPVDLFEPMASVQTNIYIFEAHKPHNFEKTVKFIDFSNDGYKRTKRGLIEQDNPTQRCGEERESFKRSVGFGQNLLRGLHNRQRR